jgi:uncharacterized membrane protein
LDAERGEPAQVPERDDSVLDEAISKSLRVGGIASIAIVAAGLVLLILAGHGGYGGAYPHDFATVAAGLRLFKPFAVIDAGLIILLFTPYLVVAVAVWFFGRHGDRLYLAVSSFVLFVLCLSAALGHVGG